MQDPSEDVFVSRVPTRLGNFRIFEGIWMRWSPFLGQAVKLGSPDEKDGPDDGQAEAVWG